MTDKQFHLFIKVLLLIARATIMQANPNHHSSLLAEVRVLSHAADDLND